jgi:tetratricopeptide (TPR) repeat protein
MKQMLAALALVVTLPLAAQVAEGDAHWNARAEGEQNGHAKAAQVDAAIAAYQKAVAANPNDLDAHWKLLRAIRFKGAYVASTNDEKKAVYGIAKKAGEAAIAHVPSKGSEKQVADAARSIAGAGQIYLWDSVNWGEWALAYGKLAAVKEGAADRIRRESTIAMLIDPKMEGGAPARVLGRLHHQTPHVPFITGWASNKEAVKFLNESLKIDPTNKITKVFLAEAMADLDSDRKSAVNDARALLKKWGA